MARPLAAATVALLLLSCGGSDTPVTGESFPAFGTVVTLQVATREPAEAAAAGARLESLYRSLEREWRSFGPGELGRANERLARGESVRVSPPLRDLVVLALDLGRRSGGLFEPRIGGLVALWGFDDLSQGLPADAPAPEAIARTREQVRATLTVEGDVIHATGPVHLELAGIAKGAALRDGRSTLAAAGIRDALITIGGDVIALGSHGSRPWRVGVRDPNGTGIIGRIELLDGEAALSSGNYERRFEGADGPAHHILDPRTGRPTRGVSGVTVVGRDAARANGAAVALMVGGAGGFAARAAALGIDCALLVMEDGRRLMTPAMRARLLPP